MMTWKKRLAIVLTTAMVLVACGGGGEDPVAETTPEAPAEDTGTPDEATNAPETDDDEEQAATSTETDESYARVTIDGTTYEFGEYGPGTTCNPDFFGGFFAVLRTEDVTGVFEIENAPDGAMTAGMNVNADGTELGLEADPEQEEFWPAVEEGSSFVESFTKEGNRAVGTISFIDTEVAFDASLFPLDPILAEFEVVCAED